MKDTAGVASAGRLFFSSLKKERIKKQIYKNRELAIGDVAEHGPILHGSLLGLYTEAETLKLRFHTLGHVGESN